MNKIFLCGMPEIHTRIVKDIATIRDVKVEKNFQQVKALAKTHKISRLCIYMDAWNCDEYYNGERGQTVAEIIHEINPGILILIWDGRAYECSDDTPPPLVVSGILKSLKFSNQIYLSFDNYNGDEILEITKKFFAGSLSNRDIPHRECLNAKIAGNNLQSQ